MTGRVTAPAKLSGNENPFGPSSKAVAAMQSECANSSRYSEDIAEELRDLLAKKEGVRPEQIVFGLGGGMVLENFARYVAEMDSRIYTMSSDDEDNIGQRELSDLDPGDTQPVAPWSNAQFNVVGPAPTYLRFLSAMQRYGVPIRSVPVNDAMEQDLQGLANAIDDNTVALYLCNPNNPTGTCVDTDEMRGLIISAASRGIPTLLDEAYLECSDDFDRRTLVSLVSELELPVCLMRTFSKIYGMAGQRIGYGVMPPIMAAGMAKFVPWSGGVLNRIGTVGAIASLQHVGYVESCRRQISAARTSLCALLDRLGRKYAVSHANFVFFHTGMGHAEFVAAMASKGVIAARAFPPFEDWSRLSLGLPQEMAAAHAALEEIFAPETVGAVATAEDSKAVSKL
eukprot:SAG31_NODE_1717_length_7457_cov_4.893177_2_plen_398_part_00